MDVCWLMTFTVWLVLVVEVRVLNPKVRFCNLYFPCLTPERTNMEAVGVFCIMFQAFVTCVVRPIGFWVIMACRFGLFRCFGWRCCLRLQCNLFSLKCVCVCVCIIDTVPSPVTWASAIAKFILIFAQVCVCVWGGVCVCVCVGCVCVCVCVCMYIIDTVPSLPRERQSERNLFALKKEKMRSSRMFELSYARRCNNLVHYRRKQGRVACLYSSFEK